MIIHCDNPTCSSVLVLELGRVITFPEQVEAALGKLGWSYTHNSVEWVAVCDRCTGDLVDA